MRTSHIFLMAALMLLTACGKSYRPTYSGHEESTEGVPGFVNGKKVSPHVKLGQSYTVDGETYVPRYQPDYVEEGMASWYGPGFHGGKTANGEVFDKNELTAAHRTLPLPSIVRVTLVSTGKQVYVRVNDRGPFAHSRIIDLSRAAAEKIGLLQAGVGKVRVEYMANESARFAELLAQGRDPKSIDVASEVLNYQAPASSGTQYADASVARSQAADSDGKSMWEDIVPGKSAQASTDVSARISQDTNKSAPVSDVVTSDLSTPDSSDGSDSPFAMLESASGAPSAGAEEQEQVIASVSPSPVSASKPGVPLPPESGRTFVQLGAFQNEENAERLRRQFSSVPNLHVIQKPNSAGQMLYHVRTGPYESNEAANHSLDRIKAMGAEAKIIRE